MVSYAAIVLAHEDWIEAASTGNIKIYDFPKERRPWQVTKLKKGSICIVMKYPKPHYFVGEFTVEDVRLLGHEEYIRNETLMHKPQRLSPGEKAYAIFFKNFRKYPMPVLKEVCTDIRTSTSKKPLSEWLITGITLIKPEDAPAFIDKIRKKAGFGEEELERPTHGELVKMLCEIGRLLGFISKKEKVTPDGVYRLDVVWTDEEGHAPLKVFEVELSHKVVMALSRLAHAWHKWRAPELYLIILDETDKIKAIKLVDPHIRGTFAEIKYFLRILTWKDIKYLYQDIKRHEKLLMMLSRRRIEL